MLQVATCTNALRAASSIKTSVPRRQQDISVPAAAATAPRPPTRSCLAHRARSLRMLVLCPTTLALFVPRLHIAPKVPPKVIRAQQAHSTRRKVNPLATAVRLVNTATPPPVKGLQHVLYAHPAVTTTERVSLSARRVRPAVRAVPQAQSPHRLVPQVSIKANGARRCARLALRAVHAHQILSRPKFVRPGILLPAAYRRAACVIKAITPAHQALPPAPLAALASTLPLPAQLLPAAVPSTSTSRRTLKPVAFPVPIRSCLKRLKPRAIPSIRRHQLNATRMSVVYVFLRWLPPSLAFLSSSSFGPKNHLQFVPFTRPFACTFSCSLRMRHSKAAPFGFC